MSRRAEHALFVVLILIVAAMAAVFATGCASSDPPPAVPEIRWLTPPPEKITVVVTFAVMIPDDPEYKFIDFEHEVILTDSEEYIEILYNDLISCTEKFTNAKIELIRIKTAQIEAAEEHGAQTDPPIPD